MMDSKVVLLKIFKSEKKNKTFIRFGKKDMNGNSNVSRGLNEYEEWYDSSAIFDKLSDGDMLVPLDAKLTYVEGFDGKAIPKLVSLINKQGIDVLGQ